MKIWLILVLNVLVCFSPSLPLSCSHKLTTSPENLRQEDGGLSLLLTNARRMRNYFFGTSVDYDILRSKVSQIYNESAPFNGGTIWNTSFRYLSTNNVYFLIALVLALALLLPLLLFLLFLYWEKCSHTVDDEGEEETEQRHSSLSSQCASWLVGSCVLLTLIPLFSFSIIILIGAERTSLSLSGSADVVNQTLPLLDEIHQGVLKRVHQVLLEDVQSLNESSYSDHIYPFAERFKQNLNSSLYDNVTDILYEVSCLTNDVESVNSWAVSLLEFETTLSNENVHFQLLLNELSTLVDLCSNYVNSSKHLLSTNCHKLISETFSSSPPPPSRSLSLFNASLLQTILESTDRAINPQAINDRINDFNEYLNNMEKNISESVLVQFQSYLHPLITNMSIVSNHIHDMYSPITYGYPRSQDIVQKYLGPNYLMNWNEFQVIVMVSFSLALFVLFIGIILSVIYGLINIVFIYLYGEDASYIRASHQAGVVLKKLSCWLLISGVVSGVFFVVMFCLASLVGRSCGIHGNYTELIDEVIDRNQSWGGVYPLGAVYHGQSSFPLTLRSVLDECSLNASSVDALQLKNVMELDLLTIGDDYHHFLDRIPISTSQSFLPHSVLGSTLRDDLYQYLSLSWPNCSSPLPLNLFEPLSLGLEELQELINDINYALDDNTTDLFNHSLITINTTLPHLILLGSWYDTVRSEAEENCSLLSLTLGVTGGQNELLEHVETEEKRFNGEIKTFAYNRSGDLATHVIATWSHFLSNACISLSCSNGPCYPVYQLFAQFTDLVCGNLLTGLDVYWMSLFYVFILSLLMVIFLLFFSCRLLDSNLLRQQSPTMFVFSFVDQSTSQILGILWLVLIYSINVWLVVAIATDRHLCEDGGSCCTSCMGFGVAFLILSLPVCVSLRIYQWIMLHRLRVYQGVKAQSVQRYWMKKINATLFYSQLVLFFLIHVPFLAIAGAYTNSRGILTGVAFLSCSLSILGMLWMVLLLILERKDLLGYMSLLQDELMEYCCRRGKFIPTTTSPDVPVGGVSNGIVASQPAEDFNETGVGVVSSPSPPIRLVTMTVLPHLSEEEEEEEEEEETEFGPETMTEEPVGLPEGTPPPQIRTEEEGEGEGGGGEEGRGEEVVVVEERITENNKRPSLWLDRRSEELDGQYTRTEPEPHRGYTGVEVAPSCQQSDTASTPRSSIYTSHESITYHSHTLPGYTSTDDSSYKDGYDSYDSEPSYPPYIPPYVPQFGSVRVDV